MIRNAMLLLLILGVVAGISQVGWAAALIRSDVPGVPTLYVDGQPVPPLFLYCGEAGMDVGGACQRQTERAREANVHLYSITIPAFAWTSSPRQLHYIEHIHAIQSIVAADPQARILLRVSVGPPQHWLANHPDEQFRYVTGHSAGVASPGSEAWVSEAERAIEEGTRILMTSEVGEYILGFHLSYYTTGEWFYPGFHERMGYDYSVANVQQFRLWLAERYGSDSALQQAWGDPEVTLETAPVPPPMQSSSLLLDVDEERARIDFHVYSAERLAQVIGRFADAVKRGSHDEALVAVFYGYLLELSRAYSGHEGLDFLLDHPAIDAFVSPISYIDRQLGGTGTFMAPIDSVALRGKLWLHEDDTRTYLTPPNAGFGRVSDPWETEQVHMRNWAAMEVRNAGLWWMDLRGDGWLDDSEIWSRLTPLISHSQTHLDQRTPYTPDIAVFVDPRIFYVTNPQTDTLSRVMNSARTALLRSGASVGFYLLSDLVLGRVPDARMYVFLGQMVVDDAFTAYVNEHLQKDGKVLVWVHTPPVFHDDAGVLERVQPERVRQLTGFEFEKRDTPRQLGSHIVSDHIVLASLLEKGATQFGTSISVEPSWSPSADEAVVLATYRDGGDPSVAMVSTDGWHSVFIGEVEVPHDLFRGLATLAGASVLTDGGDVVHVGNGLVALHARQRARVTITAPKGGKLVPLESDETSLGADQYVLRLNAGETRLFRLIEETDPVAN